MTHLRLLIGVLLAIAAPQCLAQDGSNGLGNVPMAPPTGGSSGNFYRPNVPSPPNEPTATPRPSAWPGSVPPQGPQQPSIGELPPGELKPCDGARIVARVGTTAILESEVILRKPDMEIIGSMDRVLAINNVPTDQWDSQRDKLIQQFLPNIIQTKLVYLDAKRTIPAEGWGQVEKQLGKIFDEIQVERLMKQLKAENSRELDRKLRELGTSLETEKRAFMEFELSHQWVSQQIKKDEEITYDQMVAYYHSHLKEFTKPARARWEEVMVRFAKYPDEATASDTLARMGNQILAGAPWADVARAGSDGVEGPAGGRRDWTTKGSLACQELDRALFGLPLGRPSPIIRSATGLHIVRVTERDEAVTTPFLAAQVEIRDKIMKHRSEKQLREYIAKIEARTPVKTIFDSNQSASSPSEVATPPRQQPLLR